MLGSILTVGKNVWEWSGK